MTGVTHESRLTRLLTLREQIDIEIAEERELEKVREQRRQEQQYAAELRRRQERRDAVSASTVRVWARQYGHSVPKRGRVSDGLIDLYLDANPEALRRRR